MCLLDGRGRRRSSYRKGHPNFWTKRISSMTLSAAQKLKSFIKDFISKCDQIHRKLRIQPDLLKKSLTENFIFVQWSQLETWFEVEVSQKKYNKCRCLLFLVECKFCLTKVYFSILTISTASWWKYCLLTGSARNRSSRPEVFCKKGVLRNFAKFKGKHLSQRLFFNTVAGLPATLLKKSLWHRCFPVNLAKFLRTPFLQNTPRDCFCIFARIFVLETLL